MDCLICGQLANNCRLCDEWVEVDCPDSQVYRVSRDLYVRMALRRESFDLTRTRCWLAWQHHIEPGRVPMIGIGQRYLLV